MAGKPEAREVKRVAGYVRVSTELQADSGLGLADQRRRIAHMCGAKGWPEAKFYADEGISGTKEATERPALSRLLRDVERGRVDAVVVLSLDRLGRRTRIVLDLVDTLGSRGVALISCKEQLDTSTPQGQFVLTMFAALSQLERDLIAERTRAALSELRHTTGDAGGRVPYGYVRDGERVTVDELAAEHVRRIFAMRQARHVKYSLRDIALRMPLPPPRGKEWRASSVASILANEAAYRGGRRGASEHRWPVILGAEEAAA